MRLRVGLDGAPLSVPWSGVARYVAGVSVAAAVHDPSIDISVLMYAPRRSHDVGVSTNSLTPSLRVVQMSLARSRVMSALARFAVPAPLDAFTTADVTLVTRYWGAGGRAPSAAFVYDTVWRHVPETVEARYLPRLTKLAERTIKTATSLIVMSEAVRCELGEIDPSAPSRAAVVRPARDALPHLTEGEAEFLLRDSDVRPPFVLFVGTIEPRKNLDRLLDAWPTVSVELGAATLVVAGRPGWAGASTVDRLRTTTMVRWLSPGDRLLAALYKSAEALVLPSLYEGYGLPLIEAADAGLPIACSDIPVFREVAVPESVEFFDPHDVDDMAAAVVRAARKSRTDGVSPSPSTSGEELSRVLHAAMLA